MPHGVKSLIFMPYKNLVSRRHAPVQTANGIDTDNNKGAYGTTSKSQNKACTVLQIFFPLVHSSPKEEK